MSRPLESGAYRKVCSDGIRLSDRTVAVSDFSGLTSSPWAFARAVARARPRTHWTAAWGASVSSRLKLTAPAFERLARMPCPNASLTCRSILMAMCALGLRALRPARLCRDAPLGAAGSGMNETAGARGSERSWLRIAVSGCAGYPGEQRIESRARRRQVTRGIYVCLRRSRPAEAACSADDREAGRHRVRSLR